MANQKESRGGLGTRMRGGARDVLGRRIGDVRTAFPVGSQITVRSRGGSTQRYTVTGHNRLGNGYDTRLRQSNAPSYGRRVYDQASLSGVMAGANIGGARVYINRP